MLAFAFSLVVGRHRFENLINLIYGTITVYKFLSCSLSAFAAHSLHSPVRSFVHLFIRSIAWTMRIWWTRDVSAHFTFIRFAGINMSFSSMRKCIKCDVKGFYWFDRLMMSVQSQKDLLICVPLLIPLKWRVYFKLNSKWKVNGE